MSTTPPTQTLLFLAYDRSSRELEEAIHRGGHPALQPKYGAVFAQINESGIRSTTLARGAGVTKASMGQLIDELELLGYVRRTADPSDRRAKLVLPTTKALDVLKILGEFNQEWERKQRRRLGREAYDSLRSSLETLAADGPH
jgi:DNA-binding MarR family transcriptional regulator